MQSNKVKVMIYFPHLNVIGGVEDQMFKWARRWKDTYDITIGYTLESSPETIKKLQQYAKVEKQDTVIKTDVFIDCVTYSCIKRIIKAKQIILWQHCMPNLFAGSIFDDTEYMKRVNYIVCVSETLKKAIESKGYHCKVINNDFDVKEIREKAEAFETKQYDYCFVGRFSFEKGLNRIGKFARLKRTKKFVLVGNTDKNNAYAQYCLSLPNVDIVDATDNPFPYMKNSKFVILLSNFETWGNTITESLIIGTPVITTNFEAAYEQIQNGINGYIVDMNLGGISYITDLKIKPLDYTCNWKEWGNLINGK